MIKFHNMENLFRSKVRIICYWMCLYNEKQIKFSEIYQIEVSLLHNFYFNY